jgi:hypothetical protein
VSADWLLHGQGTIFNIPNEANDKGGTKVKDLQKQIEILERLVESKIAEIKTNRELIDMQSQTIQKLEMELLG